MSRCLTFKMTRLGNVKNVLSMAEADLPAPTNALVRFGLPEEDIGLVVLFLATKNAPFITGYNLTPFGGSVIDAAR